MKIVDVCAFYTPAGGGVKTYVERKLTAGPELGQEIVIIAPGAEDGVQERGDGARIVTVKAPRFPLDKNYFYFNDVEALHAAITAEKPDMLEASSPWRSPSQVARWRGHAPRALIMHSDPLSAYAYRWFGRILERSTIDRHFEWFWRHLRRLDAHYDAVVCANSDLANRLIEGGLTKVVTNPMGVEAGVFSPQLRDTRLRANLLRRCGLGPDATLLLGVGRLAPEKRWPMVMEAVTAASYDRPVGLVLVGDGRERKRVMRNARDNPHVHLLSPITNRGELAQLLASGDALIHGCEAETFGMVAAEARASGLPLIAPDQGGVADHARGPDSQLYAANSSASAAAAIRRFIDGNPGAARAHSVAAAHMVRTMDEHFVDLFAHYQSLRANETRRVA
jgi:alpha-1,6-mannosyltransferase